MIYICVECGSCLTEAELKYYGFRCEQHEREHHDRLREWLDGKPDAEFDEMMFIEPPTKN